MSPTLFVWCSFLRATQLWKGVTRKRGLTLVTIFSHLKRGPPCIQGFGGPNCRWTKQGVSSWMLQLLLCEELGDPWPVVGMSEEVLPRFCCHAAGRVTPVVTPVKNWYGHHCPHNGYSESKYTVHIILQAWGRVTSLLQTTFKSNLGGCGKRYTGRSMTGGGHAWRSFALFCWHAAGRVTPVVTPVKNGYGHHCQTTGYSGSKHTVHIISQAWSRVTISNHFQERSRRLWQNKPMVNPAAAWV